MHVDTEKYAGSPCFALFNRREFQLPWFEEVTPVSQQYGSNFGYQGILMVSIP